MEATIEKAEQTRILYYQNTGLENQFRQAVQQTAQALNNVYTHYKFKDVSEIPSEVSAWIEKRTLEVNPTLAEMAKTIKLSSLNYQVPEWIKKAGDAFSQWHSSKSTHLQYMPYVKQDGETFVPDSELVELVIEKNPACRKYLNAEQIKRLNTCKKYIEVLKEAGMLSIDTFTFLGGRVFSTPLLRIVEGNWYPCLEYVIDGTKLPVGTSMYVTQKTDHVIYTVFE